MADMPNIQKPNDSPTVAILNALDAAAKHAQRLGETGVIVGSEHAQRQGMQAAEQSGQTTSNGKSGNNA